MKTWGIEAIESENAEKSLNLWQKIATPSSHFCQSWKHKEQSSSAHVSMRLITSTSPAASSVFP